MSDIAIVAWREFSERVRSTAFLVANGFLIGVVVISSVLVSSSRQGLEPMRLGAVTEEAHLVAVAVAEAEQGPMPMAVRRVADRDEAVALLVADELDVVILDADAAVSRGRLSIPQQLLLERVAGRRSAERALEVAGVEPEVRDAVLSPPPLEVERIDVRGSTVDRADIAVLIATAASFLLYGLLALFGQWVAQGIVEEKQSRVVEVLLGAVRPGHLLAGRLIGLGALGLFQLAVLSGTGAVALVRSSAIDVPPRGWIALIIAVLWYLPGFALYALLFAVSGSVVRRVEDLQSAVIVPMTILILGIVGAQSVLLEPASTVARLSAVIPFTAPIVQPILIAAGVSTPVEAILAAAFVVGTVAVLFPVAARIYRGGALPDGSSGLRAAWRSGRVVRSRARPSVNAPR